MPQKKYERKISLKETLNAIKFPSNLITDNIIKYLEEIQFGKENEHQYDSNSNTINDDCSHFKNFSSRNKMNGKFKENLTKKNNNFNMKPLFKKYSLRKKDKYTLDLPVYGRLVFKQLEIKRFFKEYCLFDEEYSKFFSFEVYRGFFEDNHFSFKALDMLFNNIHIHGPIREHCSSFKNFIKKVYLLIEEYEREYTSIEGENFPFAYSPEIVKLDSLSNLYFEILNQIYYQLSKEKKLIMQNHQKNFKNIHQKKILYMLICIIMRHINYIMIQLICLILC